MKSYINYINKLLLLVQHTFFPLAERGLRKLMCICCFPFSSNVTSTFFSVLLPQYGQKTFVIMLVVLKQAQHRNINVRICLITLPSNAATFSPICNNTFCIAKSIVKHATVAAFSSSTAESICFFMLVRLPQGEKNKLLITKLY